MDYWKNLIQFIKEFEDHCRMLNIADDEEYFLTWELDMAKAFLKDAPNSAVRVSKIILALKDVNDIKIKIE